MKQILRRYKLLVIMAGILLVLFLAWCGVQQYQLSQMGFDPVSVAQLNVSGRLYKEVSQRKMKELNLSAPVAGDCGDALQAEKGTGYIPQTYGDCLLYTHRAAVAEEFIVLKTADQQYKLCWFVCPSDEALKQWKGGDLLQTLTGLDKAKIERIEIREFKNNFFAVSYSACVKSIEDRAEIGQFYDMLNTLSITADDVERRLDLLEQMENDFPEVYVRLCLSSGFYYEFEYRGGFPYLGQYPLNNSAPIRYMRRLLAD